MAPRWTRARARAPRETPRAVGALLALSVSAFCYVTTENLPIGLLKVISADLHVSLSAVGLLVTGYGATVAIASVPLTHWTRLVPRRWLLSGLLVVFVLATVMSVATSSYAVLLAARITTALSQALFWAVAATTATGLFSPRARGRVISVLVTGSSFGIILGVPTGTWLGQQAGWRTAFLALSGFGLLAFLAVISLVPTAPPGRGHAAFGTAPDTRRFRIVVVTTSLVILGYFTCSTYITVFLTEVSGFTSKAIGPLLLLSGVAGIGGTVASGVVAGRSPRAAMMVPVALLMATMLGLYLLGTGRAVTAGLVALAGLSMGALVPALQNRVMEVAPGSSEIASAANSAAFNVGIAGGAFLGGVLLPVSGVRGTALAGATLAAAGLVVLLSEPLVTAPRRTPLVRRGHS